MAYKDNISLDDLFGRFFIAAEDQTLHRGYYKTIRKIRPLLENTSFLQSITGFFVNANKFINVRISYFVHENLKDQPILLFRDFLRKANLKEERYEEKPHIDTISKGYGGSKYELRFRKYLSLISKIALELLRKNPRHAKSLALTYRWQVFPLKKPSKSHFQPSFEKYSETYSSLSESCQEQLWADLDFWAHFFINPIITFDWKLSYVQEKGHKSISEINECVSKDMPDFSFIIKTDWSNKVN